MAGAIMSELTAELEDPGSIAIVEDYGDTRFRVHYELYRDEGFAGMHKGTYCAIGRVEAIDEDKTDEDHENIIWVEVDERDMNAAFGLCTIQPGEVCDAILEAEYQRAAP